MSSRPLQQDVYVSTHAATTLNEPYTSEARFDLPCSVEAPQGWDMFLTLQSLSLPHTWCNVHAGNNAIAVDGAVYTVPEGDYSVFALVSTLARALPLTVTWDAVRLKVVFSSVRAFTLTGPLLVMLDVPQGATGTTVETESVVNLIPCKSVFVLTSENGNNVDTRYRADTKRVLARVPVTSVPGGLLNFCDDSGGKAGVPCEAQAITTLTVRLEDEWGEALRCVHHWDATFTVSFIPTRRAAMPYDRPLTLAGGGVNRDAVAKMLGLVQNDALVGAGSTRSAEVSGAGQQSESVHWQSGPDGGPDGRFVEHGGGLAPGTGGGGEGRSEPGGLEVNRHRRAARG